MRNFIVTFGLAVVLCMLLYLGYIMVLWILGKVADPGNSNAGVMGVDGKTVGVANAGQYFTKDIYFWGQSSCAGNGYDAVNSCDSNRGPTNPEYLVEVEVCIDSLLIHHPYPERKDVSTKMVAANDSGLDPDITPQSARMQMKRIAVARYLDEK